VFHDPDDGLDLKKLLQNLFDRFRHFFPVDEVLELPDDEGADVRHGHVGQLDRG